MQNTHLDHLITYDSPYSVNETANRLISRIELKGLNVFSRIDHSANADAAGLALPPTELILFGNPQAGTALMQSAPTVAIDLPQKALIWQSANTATQLAFTDPNHLKQLHNIEGCDHILDKVSVLLQTLATETISGES